MDCLFDVEHINWAWGFDHSGTLILSNGTIRKYDISQVSSLLNGINKSQGFEPIKLKNSIIVGQLSSTEMDELCYLLKKVSSLPLKSIGHIAFDAGSTSFYGYRRQFFGMWQTVPLGLGGDSASIHPDPNAKILVKRLAQLTGRTSTPGLYGSPSLVEEEIEQIDIGNMRPIPNHIGPPPKIVPIPNHIGPPPQIVPF